MARRLLREPLVHVVALGVLLFALHRAVAPPDVDETVVVPAETRERLREEFRRRTGRAPSASDEQAMLAEWADDEILVREALALGLDRGDPVVRRRLVQKMQVLLESTEPVPDPSDAELATFLRAHADRYASPARVSLEHVFVSAQRAGAAASAEAADLAERLAAGADPATLGDPFLRGRTLRLHSQADLASAFGPPFAAAVMELPAGSWSAPLRSSYGLHLVRVTERQPGTTPALADVRTQVERDWRAERRRLLDHEARARLRARYRVSVEAPAP